VSDAAPPRRSDLASAADVLLAAHHGSVPLVLPNAWDVASARIVEDAGFAVVATSSRAVADVLGERDDDSADPDVVFAYLARIARSVSVPVTADLEGGYRLRPTELVDRLLGAGIVGCNLEDTDHHGDGLLVDAGRQAAFIAEVRAASHASGIHVVVNARIDTFIRGVGDERTQFDEAIRRASLYLAAGADCVYPIALADRESIEALVRTVPGPVNILARPGRLTVNELATLGVRRVSVGAGLHRLAGDRVRSAVAALAVGADFGA